MDRGAVKSYHLYNEGRRSWHNSLLIKFYSPLNILLKFIAAGHRGGCSATPMYLCIWWPFHISVTILVSYHLIKAPSCFLNTLRKKQTCFVLLLDLDKW